MGLPGRVCIYAITGGVALSDGSASPSSVSRRTGAGPSASKRYQSGWGCRCMAGNRRFAPCSDTRIPALAQSSFARQFLHSVAAKLLAIATADAPIGGANGQPQWLQPMRFARQLQKNMLATMPTRNASCQYRLKMAHTKLDAKNNASAVLYSFRGLTRRSIMVPGRAQTSCQTPL